MGENFCKTKKKALDPFWFVTELIERVKREKDLTDKKVEFQIVREFSEKLEKQHSEAVEQVKNVLMEIYNVMAGESPSELRTKILTKAEIGLFGRPLDVDDESEVGENGTKED